MEQLVGCIHEWTYVTKYDQPNTSYVVKIYYCNRCSTYGQPYTEIRELAPHVLSRLQEQRII